METTEELSVAPATPARPAGQPGVGDHVAAAGLISGHAIEHVFGHAFYVLLPSMYTSLGLTPLAAGLVGSMKNMGFGLASTVGGVVVDRIQHRRLLILYISMATMGVGYLLVGLAPNYMLILMAMLLTSVAGAIWHPAARSLLSQIYPNRRGLILSLDRSGGSVGDTVGPLGAGSSAAGLHVAAHLHVRISHRPGHVGDALVTPAPFRHISGAGGRDADSAASIWAADARTLGASTHQR